MMDAVNALVNTGKAECKETENNFYAYFGKQSAQIDALNILFGVIDKNFPFFTAEDDKNEETGAHEVDKFGDT